jgi:protein tyrosine phosphatase (PTP) superfamily phosphohydrolase (DUF442 family)
LTSNAGAPREFQVLKKNMPELTVTLFAIPRAVRRVIFSLLISCLPLLFQEAAWANNGQSDASANPTVQPSNFPQKLHLSHLPNAIRLNDRVISGGLPEGDAGMAQLRDLGVKTIISVDGVRPDLASAQRYGLRYVHLPHGYDGISKSRGEELAKAVSVLPGPLYIHCHHGKHRSPAAAVVACQLAGFPLPMPASELLKYSGTSPHYQGLYQSAAAAKPLDRQFLLQLPQNFPQLAKLPPMAESMVAIEHTFDHLKLISLADWQTPPAHPALDPAHEALLLREHFVELQRLPAVKGEPPEFRHFIASSLTHSEQLERILRQSPLTEESQIAQKSSLGTHLQAISESCTACHRAYRDNPRADLDNQ